MSEQEPNQVGQTAQNMMDAFNKMAEAMSAWVQQTMSALIPVLNQMYQALYAAYQEAGMPYGDSQEGCLRWLEERAEAQRLIAHAERIIDHHEGLAYLRKRIAERKMEQEQS
jgi:hypothetical protein